MGSYHNPDLTPKKKQEKSCNVNVVIIYAVDYVISMNNSCIEIQFHLLATKYPSMRMCLLSTVRLKFTIYGPELLVDSNAFI